MAECPKQFTLWTEVYKKEVQFEEVKLFYKRELWTKGGTYTFCHHGKLEISFVIIQ